MTSNKQGIEAISVRRAKLADDHKVRYRVYSNATEFVAVIAESALMAVKVSGVTTPYKIIRDLPTDGIAIEAKKIAEHEAGAERVNFTTMQPAESVKLVAELPEHLANNTDRQFIQLDIADLQRKGKTRARILSPEMLSEIIEEHARIMASKLAEETQAKTAAAVPPTPAPFVPAPVQEAAPVPSAEDNITRMASELLPEQPTTVAAAADEVVLSPEEVEKLLNG